MNNISELLIQKYNRSIPRYTSYPTVPDWKLSSVDQNLWLNNLSNQLEGSDGLSLYIHLPYCESLCTYCGCNKRITKNHSVEASYIDSILQEWDIYAENLPTPIVIKEIHLGGGTPTFFSPEPRSRVCHSKSKRDRLHLSQLWHYLWPAIPDKYQHRKDSKVYQRTATR